jgi:ribosome biogenesis ATPase
MDLIAPKFNRNQAPVLVLGATNRPDAMDAALRRAGRFDKEILLGVPDEAAREGILRQMTKNMRLSGDFDFKVLARKTPGYVGADVKSLTKEAAVIAINRIFRDVLTDEGVMPSDDFVENAGLGAKEASENETNDAADQNSDTEQTFMSVTPLTPEQMEPLYVTMSDFLSAIPLVQPSSKREGFATVPDVSWDDIGALQEVRDELTLSVLEPIRNPETFHALGLSLPAGVLLYGPPGCGKTLLAKAIAHESGANFISVKGPELLDKYVGESERAVRVVFERARSSSPCVVFFDELDSLCPKRGSDSGGGGVSERVVNQLLTEMDGLDSRRSVFVIAATNRPELIDPAMMRP